MSQHGDEQSGTDDIDKDADKEQKSVTLKQPALDELREVYPDALDDSERVRRAIWRAKELEQADSYQINHGSE